MTMFGISRGFRRLSVALGIIGFVLSMVLFASDPYHHLDGSPIPQMKDQAGISVLDYVPDSERFDHLLIMGGFVLGPMILALLTGWVVAGFREK